MSAYLQKAAEYTNEQGNDIVMAMDLKDVPDPFYMANSIKSSKVLAGTDFKAKTLTKLLSSLEGITLIIKADEKVSGKIIIHFGENTFSIKEYAKDLLLEYLSNTGAYVNDFDDWQATVVGKVVTLEGDMTVDSLRCILSLIEIPTPTNQPVIDSNQPVIDSNQPVKDPSRPVKEPNDVAGKSQKYFQAVKLHVDGLRKLARGPSITVYMRKYAVKIENLPILGVDKDLQNYGADVAYYLRAGADQLRAASNRSLAGQARYHGGRTATRYGRYGGIYGGRSDYAYQAGERKRVTMEEKASGFSNAIDVLREIDIETSQIRRLLTDRYKVEF